MAQVTRGERLLEKWVNDPRVGITEAGKNWFIAAVDPFHDHVLKDLQGWPDVETAHSVVRCVKSSKSFAGNTGGGAPVAPWDCHIALMPWLHDVQFWKSTEAPSSGRKNNLSLFDGTTASEVLGGLALRATFTSGADVDWFPITGATTDLGTMTLDDEYLQGVGRLIGYGYEITDTTAELYKQGSLMCWRQAEGARDCSSFTFVDQNLPATETARMTYTGQLFRAPPVNTAQAMLYPGSRQWAMKEGLYQVATFHSTENPPFSVDYVCPVVLPAVSDDEMGLNKVNTTPFRFAAGVDLVEDNLTVGATVLTLREFCPAPQHINPTQMCGAILSGLHPNATFTVSTVAFYESFPNISERAILPLATPSAQYEPDILNIYSHAMSVMPVGVMLRENETGHWFTDVVSQVGQIVSPLVSMLPFPAAKIIGPLIGSAASAIGGARATQVHNSGVPNGPAFQKPKRKKGKKKNAALAQGNRGKKGHIQGPLRQ